MVIQFDLEGGGTCRFKCIVVGVYDWWVMLYLGGEGDGGSGVHDKR